MKNWNRKRSEIESNNNMRVNIIFIAKEYEKVRNRNTSLLKNQNKMTVLKDAFDWDSFSLERQVKRDKKGPVTDTAITPWICISSPARCVYFCRETSSNLGPKKGFTDLSFSLILQNIGRTPLTQGRLPCFCLNMD